MNEPVGAAQFYPVIARTDSNGVGLPVGVPSEIRGFLVHIHDVDGLRRAIEYEKRRELRDAVGGVVLEAVEVSAGVGKAVVLGCVQAGFAAPIGKVERGSIVLRLISQGVERIDEPALGRLFFKPRQCRRLRLKFLRHGPGGEVGIGNGPAALVGHGHGDVGFHAGPSQCRLLHLHVELTAGEVHGVVFAAHLSAPEVLQRDEVRFPLAGGPAQLPVGTVAALYFAVVAVQKVAEGNAPGIVAGNEQRVVAAGGKALQERLFGGGPPGFFQQAHVQFVFRYISVHGLRVG